MYNGIGLQTPRGSGTNGYTQSNKFFNPNRAVVTGGSNNGESLLTPKVDKEIIEHNQKRQVQLKLAELEDKLIDQGYTDAEIAQKLGHLRKSLESELELEDGEIRSQSVAALNKEAKVETMRTALGIKSESQRR